MPYPGGVDCVTFGKGLVGVLYTAPSDQSCPTAILLHGIPGAERNVDIAYRLRELGWHTLILSFGGAWGSAGAYDMTTQPDDALAALDFLVTPGNPWQIDTHHIAIIGYSLGGRAAFVAAKRDTRIGAVVSLAAITDFEELMLSDQFFVNALPFLRDASVKSLSMQWRRLAEDNPVTIIKTLTQPVLIVHGTQDETVPPYMAEVLYDMNPARATLRMIDNADHMFTRHRGPVVEIITNWLQEWSKNGSG